MDQIKQIFRQAIKYRFWIVVGVAALLPMIAYFAAAGSINKETEQQASAIKAASTDIKQYESGLLPNDEYKTLVEQRTEVLNNDINQAWRLLYNQQAPLLTWPEEVADRFTTWGRQWPADVDVASVNQTVLDYIQIYPREVDKVYNIFRPFDYKEGTGVVVAPVKESLLRPAGFDIAKPPSLGQVWGAQQKLWIQQTVLSVIDKVNTAAKDWDSAPVKEITALEVASQQAQDQKSIVAGEVLELTPEIVKPGAEATASASAPAATSAYASQNSGGGSSDAQYAAMMEGMYMSGGDSGGGGAKTKPEEVFIFKAASPTQPFQVVPVHVSVLIDQRRILELIAAFENSPMDIQIVDFEMSRPQKKVEKPEKGQINPSFGYGMMGGETILGGYGMMQSMMGYGQSGYGNTMDDSSMMRQQMGGYGGYGMGAPAVKKRTGTDIAQKQLDRLKAKTKDKSEEDKDKKAESGRGGYSDPYYDVVEVKLYGHARFFNPPPPPEPEVAPTDSAGLTAETPADASADMPADETASAESPATDTAAPADAAEPAAPAVEEAAPVAPAVIDTPAPADAPAVVEPEAPAAPAPENAAPPETPEPTSP